jgi:serine-type D-Ala-D-Ala carboxypeptidase (penicillin-binding protein 5/6)
MQFPRFLVASAALCAVAVAFAQSAPIPNAAPSAGAATVQIPAAPTPTGAASWLIMDYSNGQVLASQNPDQRLEPASITKVMTSYVVAAELKAGKIKATDQVLISENAWRGGGGGTDGSTSFLPLGSSVSLEELERGMVIQSGNDAAIALAEHVAGSEQAFVELMNTYAKKIGMNNTNFMNPHGLPDPNHYSTARDLALMGRALIRDFPKAYAFNGIKEYTVNGIRQHNRNGLLWKDPSVDGIKTGHTSSAGYCLLASAKRGEQRLISVVLGIQTTSSAEGFRLRENGNLALLNWGFRFFETRTLYTPDKAIATPRVWKGAANAVALAVAAPFSVTVPRGKFEALKANIDVPKYIIAPLKAGQKIGVLRISLDGKVIAEAPLVAKTAVAEAGFFGRLWDGFLMWWDKL